MRLKYFVASLAPSHKDLAREVGHEGVILLFDTVCMSHVIHRVIENAFRTRELTPRLRSVCVMAGETGRAEQVLHAAKSVPRPDLCDCGGLFPRIRPPVAAQRIRRQVR